MNRNSSVAILLTVMLAGQSTALAHSAPVVLMWGELSSILPGHDIELVLPGGHLPQGRGRGRPRRFTGSQYQEDLKLEGPSQGERRGPLEPR